MPRLFGTVAAVLGASALLQAFAPALAATPLPHYRVEVRLDTAAHTLAGTVTVTLARGDPRVGAALWFHLPPNRFAEQDPRGPRRPVNALRFETGFTRNDRFDPDWPDGFDPGRIEIHEVRDGHGVELPFSLAANPTIPQGYSVEAGLLRVDLNGSGATDTVVLRFTTHLPQRYWDGWSEGGIITDAWYPSLAAWRDGAWDLDVFTPRGARYSGAIQVSSEGALYLGHGRSWHLQADEAADLPEAPVALRTLPLVFVAVQHGLLRHDYDLSVYSHFRPEHERMGRLALAVGERFRHFLRRQYGLAPPFTRLSIVEVDLPPRDIIVVGGLILVPTSHYRNAAAMDRMFVANLARALAQVWFGETVWSNRDTQSWLHLGLGGYLALDFFESTYGPDAGVHNLVDWLQPKYREHFFEAPIRDLMRGGKDAPLMLSLRRYPEFRTAMLVAFNKAPLVLRSLDYRVGHAAFARGLHALYRGHRSGVVTEDTLRETLEAAAGENLRPFFESWFHGTPQVDFAVEDWEQIATTLGYRVQVQVRREAPPQTPVTVQVSTQSGLVFTQRWAPGEPRAVLTFDLPEPAVNAAIDPDEAWLELDRKDNRSELQLRWRPLFDWAKQRELLIAVRATAGGNSTDGNYYGLGVNVSLNENNQLRIMPIYGDRTGLRNYQVTWDRSEFLIPTLRLSVGLERLGGSTLQSLGLAYAAVDTDFHKVGLGLSLNATTVRDDILLEPDGTARIQPRSRANHAQVGFDYSYHPDPGDQTSVGLLLTDSQAAYDSDYTFTSIRLDLGQRLALGGSHLLNLQATRAATKGTPPLQLRHGLGGPSALRGYPRSIQLTSEQMALGRLEYGFVITRKAMGGTAQVRRTTVFLFGEVGRGWDGGETYSSRPQRQDVGIGMEFLINLARLNEVPIRVDLAYPIADDEYRDPQWVLLGLLSF